jgi:hypothetical protein
VEETGLKLEHVGFQIRLLKLWRGGCEVMISEFRVISYLVFRTIMETLQSTVPTYRYITLHADDDDDDDGDGDSRCQ